MTGWRDVVAKRDEISESNETTSTRLQRSGLHHSARSHLSAAHTMIHRAAMLLTCKQKLLHNDGRLSLSRTVALLLLMLLLLQLSVVCGDL